MGQTFCADGCTGQLSLCCLTSNMKIFVERTGRLTGLAPKHSTPEGGSSESLSRKVSLVLHLCPGVIGDLNSQSRERWRLVELKPVFPSTKPIMSAASMQSGGIDDISEPF